MSYGKTKEENKRLLIGIVKAESALVDLWLTLDQDKVHTFI